MSKSEEYSELTQKIIQGFRIAYDKLIIKTAKDDGELAFSENGKIRIVKAKDLLKDKAK